MPTDLDSLRVQGGFRLRGESVSRLETFVDAAFAFGVTMMVISVGRVPDSSETLMHDLRHVPTFVASFLILVLFWTTHNSWSRRYGLETPATSALSLAFVLVTLVWIFPLRYVMGGALSFVTGDWVPPQAKSHSGADLQDCFLVYGLGFGALSAITWQLYRIALRSADELQLDELERLQTRRDLGSQAILLGVAFVSIVLTFVVRRSENWLLTLPGFTYSAIGPAMHLHHARFHRLEREAGLTRRR